MPIFNSLPTVEFFAKIQQDPELVILCATNRIARHLQLAFEQFQIASGTSVWTTPAFFTFDSWLENLGEQLSLLGEAPLAQIPSRVLSSFQAGLIWKKSIEAVGSEHAFDLFDLHGLAKTAAEADALISAWHIQLSDEGSEETQQLLRWRKQFYETCRKQHWATVLQYQRRVFDWLQGGELGLPATVVFAGFDVLSPHQQQFSRVLNQRGVHLFNLEFSAEQAPQIEVFECDDAELECRAAAAWAQAQLAQNPMARLGIVVADLEARRSLIVPILDEALNASALSSADDAAPKCYNVSLGLPLSRFALVRSAFALLNLLVSRQGLSLTEWGDFLRMPYWSAEQSEADLRALMDAQLRQKASQKLTLKQLLHTFHSWPGFVASKIHNHLIILSNIKNKLPQKALPSAWVQWFSDALSATAWPGERILSSTEFQTQTAFFEVLANFAVLDDFLGEITCPTANGEFSRLCRERIFQPKTVGQPALQVLGMIEAKGMAFDALWVMGMNDQHWPPPARPNALLPAKLQRTYQTPGSCAEVQSRFASDIHQRLLQSSPHVTFSYAKKDGERELLASPLLGDFLKQKMPPPMFKSPFFAHQALDFEWLEDAQAPAIALGEEVGGGSSLLKAQAICPAWAFYRYRLGAQQLNSPNEGLDASQRGTIVHSVLENFWREVKNSAALSALDETQLHDLIEYSVNFALAKFEKKMGVVLAPTFRALEASRLQKLSAEWLALEGSAARLPFKVLACEKSYPVLLGNLRFNLVIDRIDELQDGRRLVLDYKTGAQLDTQNWFGEQRITEPQLPLYAAIVLNQQQESPLVAVVFAKVRLRDCQFKGVAAEENVLPKAGVTVLKPTALPVYFNNGAADEFCSDSVSENTAWLALLASWKIRIEAVADEIQRGEAGVFFANEDLLKHCEVKPLLRLAERKMQFERLREQSC